MECQKEGSGCGAGACLRHIQRGAVNGLRTARTADALLGLMAAAQRSSCSMVQTPQQLQITQVPPGVQLTEFAPPPPPPAPPPPQWTQHHDPSTGKPYWANQQGQTTWEDPNTPK